MVTYLRNDQKTHAILDSIISDIEDNKLERAKYSLENLKQKITSDLEDAYEAGEINGMKNGTQYPWTS
jgi:hypothetical protein